MKIIIQGGRVVDPANQTDGLFDVLIEDGKIKAVGKNLPVGQDVRLIDARGLLVTPGLIDMHVHLREPGREDKETIATGCAAAAAGGVTSLACMPNTSPVNDNKSVTEFILRRSREVDLVGVYPIGAISKGLRGEEMAEMAEIWEAGAVACSDDGRPVMNALLMRRALEYARLFDFPLISHCEDLNLSADGVVNEGYISTLTGLKGIPAAAEEVMVARDLLLAKMTKGRLHIAHVSTATSCALIRQAKQEGVQVTAEATPHHFSLTEDLVANFDPNTKVNPPLRTQADRQAVIEALADGTIDAIASDHAPHTLAEKEQEYDLAPFGIVGLETLLSVSLTNLYHTRKLDLLTLIAKLTVNPAKILNLPAGTLSVGSAADICLIDPEKRIVVDASRFYSKGRNTPFHGQELKGCVVMTLRAGRVVFPRDTAEAVAGER
ncbi:MAG: dihydroorotase [bacterium]|nr:dihydroorotase [bacterium]